MWWLFQACRVGGRVSDSWLVTLNLRHDEQCADMEDAWSVQLPLCPMESSSAYFAVFDGHGSRSFSAYSAQHLHSILVDNSSFCEYYNCALCTPLLSFTLLITHQHPCILLSFLLGTIVPHFSYSHPFSSLLIQAQETMPLG